MGHYDAALNHIRASRLTDVELIYAPSQIALAAFSLANPDLESQWMTTKVSDPVQADSLNKIVNDIKAIITSEGQPPSVDAVREVDRRLRLCKNPEKVVGTKAYLAKKSEDERIVAQKRRKKAADTETATDPFGTELEKKGLVDYDDEDEDDD